MGYTVGTQYTVGMQYAVGTFSAKRSNPHSGVHSMQYAVGSAKRSTHTVCSMGGVSAKRSTHTVDAVMQIVGVWQCYL